MAVATAGAEKDVYDALREHIARHWPGHHHEEFSWRQGPIMGRLPQFRVRRVCPVHDSDAWVYCTLGAWEAGAGPHRTEFFILSPSETPQHVESLAMVTYFHLDDRYRLSVGRDMQIGHPWIEGSQADRFVVAPAHALPESFEVCRAGELEIHYRWLVPITPEESAYLHEHGFGALEDLMEQSQVNLLDPARASLVSPRAGERPDRRPRTRRERQQG